MQSTSLCSLLRAIQAVRDVPRVAGESLGFYGWLKTPTSERAKEDKRLLGLIKHYWRASGGVDGYRKIAEDQHDLRERCSHHLAHRLMHNEGCVCR